MTIKILKASIVDRNEYALLVYAIWLLYGYMLSHTLCVSGFADDDCTSISNAVIFPRISQLVGFGLLIAEIVDIKGRSHYFLSMKRIPM